MAEKIKNGVLRGTPFEWELEGGYLKVTHQNYDADSGAGQGQVRSAFYRVLEELGMDRMGELRHSGGYCGAVVKPAPADERD